MGPKRLWTGGVAAVAVTLLTLTGCGGADEAARDTGSEAPAAVPGGLPAVVAKVDPSIVTVIVGQGGIGSGVVYREGGYVVTNAHVVGASEQVEVELADGSRTPAEVLATDEITDLAVLRAKRDNLPPARFQIAQPQVGELVVALGSPLGFQNSATAGIVSGLGREIPGAAARGARSLVDLIQTDAAISPGNSGGALVNAAGEIVGVNEAYIPPGTGAVSLGFAIPAATVVDVVDQLIADGAAQHPFLGVATATLTPQVAEAFGLEATDGALVQSVQPGGPADAAGIRSGDVMIGFAGERVRSAEAFLGELRSVDPGDRVDITLRSADTERTVQVTIGTLDQADS